MITTLSQSRLIHAAFTHPLTLDQTTTAIRHAQRQGEASYVLWSNFTIGATFTVRSNVEAMLAGSEPWPGSFMPGLHSHSCRIFVVSNLGLIQELVS